MNEDDKEKKAMLAEIKYLTGELITDLRHILA